jgi:hypothetical protein
VDIPKSENRTLAPFVGEKVIVMPNDLNKFLPDKTVVFPGAPQGKDKAGEDREIVAGSNTTYGKPTARFNPASGEKQENLSQ